MRPERVIQALVGSGLLAAWLAGTTSAPLPPTLERPTAPAVSFDLDPHMERLTGGTVRAPAPRNPARNPFQFVEPSTLATQRDAHQGELPLIVPPSPSLREPLPVLVGLAEDQVEGAPIRTAILSYSAETILAREGDELAERYFVERISSDSVILRDLRAGTVLTLTFR
jgi:hypothetical protein